MPRTAPSEALAPTPPRGAVPLSPGRAFSRAGASLPPGESPAPILTELPDTCACYDCGTTTGWFAHQLRGSTVKIVCHKHFTQYARRPTEAVINKKTRGTLGAY